MGAFHSTQKSALNLRQLTVAKRTALSKIFKKKDNLASVPKFWKIISRKFIFFPFNFAPEISRIFVWTVRISEIKQFPEFLETFSGNFRTICRCFQIFESIGSM